MKRNQTHLVMISRINYTCSISNPSPGISSSSTNQITAITREMKLAPSITFYHSLTSIPPKEHLISPIHVMMKMRSFSKNGPGLTSPCASYPIRQMQLLVEMSPSGIGFRRPSEPVSPPPTGRRRWGREGEGRNECVLEEEGKMRRVRSS